MTKHYKERPCPGDCGRVERYGPQHLCQNCRRQLKLGKKREREIAELELSGELIRVAIGPRFHYGTAAYLSFLSIPDTDVIRALTRLGKLERTYGGGYAESRCIHYVYAPHGPAYGRRPTEHVWATPEQADDIELILDYIKMVIEKAYSDGLAEGRSLLLHLAAAGAKELSEVTIAGGKGK